MPPERGLVAGDGLKSMPVQGERPEQTPALVEGFSAISLLREGVLLQGLDALQDRSQASVELCKGEGIHDDGLRKVSLLFQDGCVGPASSPARGRPARFLYLSSVITFVLEKRSASSR